MKEWKRNKRQKKGKGKEDEVALRCSALRAPPKNKNKNKKTKRKVWKSISSPSISYPSPSFHLFPPCLTLLFLPIQTPIPPFYVPPTIILNNLGVVLATNPL